MSEVDWPTGPPDSSKRPPGLPPASREPDVKPAGERAVILVEQVRQRTSTDEVAAAALDRLEAAINELSAAPRPRPTFLLRLEAETAQDLVAAIGLALTRPTGVGRIAANLRGVRARLEYGIEELDRIEREGER